MCGRGGQAAIAAAMASVRSRLVTLGTVAMALGLFGLCAQTLVDPVGASQGYGVPAQTDLAWVTAAGVRDGVLGLVALGLLRWHRSALPLFLAAVLVLPVADVALSFVHGEAWTAVAPHAVGTVAIGVLLALSLPDGQPAR